ncbi:MAG: four helix bundle protein [Bacteroidetes bacterium]|nr:four helix bundle protein [Bacteroidota bacterium]MBS1980103.1 four helix bundle protein [Bacteroidota bacterium]
MKRLTVLRTKGRKLKAESKKHLMKDYRQLKTWMTARKAAQERYLITKKITEEKQNNLVSQLRKSALSITMLFSYKLELPTKTNIN